MTYKDGDTTEIECKFCGTPMVFEMSFYDTFDPVNGHNTADQPIIFCPKCDHSEGYDDGHCDEDPFFNGGDGEDD